MRAYLGIISNLKPERFKLWLDRVSQLEVSFVLMSRSPRLCRIWTPRVSILHVPESSASDGASTRQEANYSSTVRV